MRQWFWCKLGFHNTEYIDYEVTTGKLRVVKCMNCRKLFDVVLFKKFPEAKP